MRLLSMLCALVFGAACGAQDLASEGELDKMVIQSFLQEYFHDPVIGSDPMTRYSYSEVNLDADPLSEVVVYVTGQRFCGSGGCVMLILKQDESSSLVVVSRVTLVHLPIYVLETSTNGWKDLGLRVQGGGIQPGYLTKLEFDGATYPSNPSVGPRLDGSTRSTILSLSEVGELLYE